MTADARACHHKGRNVSGRLRDCSKTARELAGVLAAATRVKHARIPKQTRDCNPISTVGRSLYVISTVEMLVCHLPIQAGQEREREREREGERERESASEGERARETEREGERGGLYGGSCLQAQFSITVQ